MKAKLIVNNKEIEVEISEEELKKLEKKQTGYERVQFKDTHYYDSHGQLGQDVDRHDDIDNRFYEIADYYSDKVVAANNIRADKLMRQLRRFAVEHREKEIDLSAITDEKYDIVYNYGKQDLEVEVNYAYKKFGAIYFNTEETAKLAIDTFHDELIWYFTEYKDSL